MFCTPYVVKYLYLRLDAINSLSHHVIKLYWITIITIVPAVVPKI